VTYCSIDKQEKAVFWFWEFVIIIIIFYLLFVAGVVVCCTVVLFLLLSKNNDLSARATMTDKVKMSV